MAKTNKADMSCARVKQYTAFDVSKAERHNERKNETYENMNVITERIALNVHFKKPTVPTYMEQLKQMETDGFNYMTERGFKGFQRGEYGSTAEHLTSLQYQIQQDKERLEKLQKRIQKEQVKYEPARHISKTLNEIDGMGQKTFTGKMAISKEDYSQLTALAKEGITSRAEINKLEQSANYYRQKYFDSANALERMKTKYNELKEKCRPFLEALEHFPEVAKLFTEKVKQLFSFKEAQERAEKEARERESFLYQCQDTALMSVMKATV